MDCPTCHPPVVWWRVFDAAPFMRRVDCGAWPDWLVAGWCVSSVGLLVLYWLIAATVLVLWYRSRGAEYPYHRLPWIAAFFLGCGGGHAMNAVAFVWPGYVAFVVWDWLTFAASLAGAVGVYRLAGWARGRVAALVAERDSAAERVAAATAERDEWERKLRAKYERDGRQQAEQKRQLDALKLELQALLHRVLTDADYAALRKRLHEIRGAAQ